MKQALFAVACLLWWAAPAFASCTGASPTWTSSVDRASVATCVSNAVSGDTINVAAGSASWSPAIDIPNGKNLILAGAGIGNTTITSTGMARVLTLNDTSSRVTGFTFDQAQIGSGEGESGSTRNNDFRIDHNRFVGTNTNNAVAVMVQCSMLSAAPGVHCRGLVDHNTFEQSAIAETTGFKATSDVQATWNVASQLGGANALFIEDNTFSGPATAAESAHHYVDTNTGGRFVLRFNTIVNMAAEVHSLQSDRGSRTWEIYQNTSTLTAAFCCWTQGLIKGGIGVIWGNTATGTTWGPWVVNNVRSGDTTGSYQYGICNGGSTADGNQGGQQGYICRDQIGSGVDAGLSAPSDTTGSATGWFAQAHEPAYFWLNRTDGAITSIDNSHNCGGECPLAEFHIQFNRDIYQESTATGSPQTVGTRVGTIANRPTGCTAGVGYWATDEGEWNSNQAGADGRLYKCTATNTWTLYYTPYTYPHPLQGAGGGPAPPIPDPPRYFRVAATTVYRYLTPIGFIGVGLAAAVGLGRWLSRRRISDDWMAVGGRTGHRPRIPVRQESEQPERRPGRRTVPAGDAPPNEPQELAGVGGAASVKDC